MRGVSPTSCSPHATATPRVVPMPVPGPTAHLEFRWWDDQEDAEGLAWSLWGDERVTALIGGPWSADQVHERLRSEAQRRQTDGMQYWPIFRRGGAVELVGCAGLRPSARRCAPQADGTGELELAAAADPRVLEVGFHLRPEYWGRGLATEAATAALTHAFANLGASAVCAGHHPRNDASRRTLLKLGFEYSHDEFYPPTGLEHPTYFVRVPPQAATAVASAALELSAPPRLSTVDAAGSPATDPRPSSSSGADGADLAGENSPPAVVAAAPTATPATITVSTALELSSAVRDRSTQRIVLAAGTYRLSAPLVISHEVTLEPATPLTAASPAATPAATSAAAASSTALASDPTCAALVPSAAAAPAAALAPSVTAAPGAAPGAAPAAAPATAPAAAPAAALGCAVGACGAEAPAVVIIGAVVLSAGSLRGLMVRAPSKPMSGATSDATPPAVDLPAGSRASLDRCEIVAADRALRPSSASATRPVGCHAAALAAAVAPPPLALRIGSGATARVTRCRVRGGVSVGRSAAPLLQSNELLAATSTGVELRGTSLSCELRDNTIADSGGAGVLLVAGAATIADNRIVRTGGAGVDIVACGAGGGSAAPAPTSLVLRNSIESPHGAGLLVRDGGRAELRENRVCGSFTSGAEVSGAHSHAILRANQLCDGVGGVGVLVHACATSVHVEANVIDGFPLAGVEIADGACPDVCRNTVRHCGQSGILIASGGAGRISHNSISANLRHGIECCSSAAALAIEHNTISGHRCGAGVLVRAGGGGVFVRNVISGNMLGVELGVGARTELRANKIHANARAGLDVGPGARASLIENTVRANGNGRVVRGNSRRGERTHGDDAGAGIVVRPGGDVTLEANHISMNAGPGVFAHADARATLARNEFRGNRGSALAARPHSRTSVLSSADARRPVTPAIVRRQRVPFDWTVGDNVGPADKSLEERAAEMRAEYLAMRGGDKESAALALLPPGVNDQQTSAACAVS